MSYEAKSIHEVVAEIEAGKFYLPALQRKFVWNESRITLLFDSILRGYPISTFLFWFLKKDTANNYVFYKFLDRYDDRDPFNKRKDGLFTQDEIIGVLDGQQRLSSIYIGLQGTYITKKKYKWAKSADAYPERKLYLNLLNTPYLLEEIDGLKQVVIEEERNFDFRFLKTNDLQNKPGEYWFKVGELIRWNSDTSPTDVFESLLAKEEKESVREDLQRQQRFIVKTIENLRDKFIKEQNVTYFKTQKEDLEAILNIFVRVNSGAVTLSRSDLLFSTIIATWEKGRQEIEGLQTDLNKKGDGFGFNNDFLMRSLLVLSDIEVRFKVNSFKSENVKIIKENWEGIKSALNQTVDLLAESGLSKSLITSQNAVIPIAYYIYKGGILNQETKHELIKYLKHALIKNVFGSQGDNVLSQLRSALRVKNDLENNFELRSPDFKFQEFLKILKLSGDKSLQISDENLEGFLSTKKNEYSYLLLSMIYPHFKYGQVKLHQDHIHPHSGFTNDLFNKWNMSDDQKQDWWDKRDMLPNLQLMEGGENQSKNAKPFDAWLAKEFSNDKGNSEAAFLERNFIDPNTSLLFQDFQTFFKLRKQKLSAAFKEVLALK